jgi:hypothetical protein
VLAGRKPGLLNAAQVMSSRQVELPNAVRSRTERGMDPQGLKPSSFAAFTARLKSCPDTKRFLKLARNRLIRTLVLQASIKLCYLGSTSLPETRNSRVTHGS